MNWNQIKAYDERRNIAIPGNHEKTIQFCVDQFLTYGNAAISEHGNFAVALSGGSTPKEIYQCLAKPEHRNKLDWSKVLLFWSDERCVPHDSPESNYRMAMENGFSKLPLLKENIFPIPTEGDPNANAQTYEDLIIKHVHSQSFDLMTLGMGEDGHTASLFPKTHGLHPNERLVIANFIPQMNAWRITLTFDCINASQHIAIYVLGKSKANMVKKALTDTYDPDNLPIQRVGTPSHKALWILDNDSAKEIYQ